MIMGSYKISLGFGAAKIRYKLIKSLINLIFNIYDSLLDFVGSYFFTKKENKSSIDEYVLNIRRIFSALSPNWL